MLPALVAATALSLAPPMDTPIEAKGPLGPLKGSMLRPASGTGPMALIIPGSGPTDRDGNNPLGVKAASYRLLAEALARQGVGSVRIDKRGMFESKAAVADANAVTIAGYAADAHAWIDAIRAKTGVACVWLIGHSEGGLIALAAAQRDTPRQASGICGVVLLAAAGRPLDQVMREQLHAHPQNAPLLDQADTAIDTLKAGRRYDTTNMARPLMLLFQPKVQGFLIDEFAYDPAALIAKMREPVLIVQGESDVQVSVADARRLANANPKAELALLPKVNHVLKEVTGEGLAANSATYSDPDLPLAPGLAETVGRFITSR